MLLDTSKVSESNFPSFFFCNVSFKNHAIEKNNLLANILKYQIDLFCLFFQNKLMWSKKWWFQKMEAAPKIWRTMVASQWQLPEKDYFIFLGKILKMYTERNPFHVLIVQICFCMGSTIKYAIRNENQRDCLQPIFLDPQNWEEKVPIPLLKLILNYPVKQKKSGNFKEILWQTSLMNQFLKFQRR